MSLFSDKDYSESFRSRDGVERTRTAGERFLSLREWSMVFLILFGANAIRDIASAKTEMDLIPINSQLVGYTVKLAAVPHHFSGVDAGLVCI